MDCPQCEAVIMAAAPISNSPKGLKNGNIVVCAHCHTICKVRDGNLSKMKKSELKALDKISKRVLNITINKLKRNPVQDN